MVDQSEVTVIGETILVTGSLRGDENLTVLGRVEGQVNLSQTLLVADGAVVKAEVNVHNAVISGIVVGNITATDCIHVTATGQVLGDVTAKRMILDAKGRVRGAIAAGTARAKERGASHDRSLATSHSHASEPTSLMARRQLSQHAARSNTLGQTPTSGGAHHPTSQEAVGGSHGRSPQEAMAMAVKKKVAGKKRG